MLPVRQRVDFKLALLVYKALHDSTAVYLVDDCQLYLRAFPNKNSELHKSFPPSPPFPSLPPLPSHPFSFPSPFPLPFPPFLPFPSPPLEVGPLKSS